MNDRTPPRLRLFVGHTLSSTFVKSERRVARIIDRQVTPLSERRRRQFLPYLDTICVVRTGHIEQRIVRFEESTTRLCFVPAWQLIIL
jgi:hypothetical protein